MELSLHLIILQHGFYGCSSDLKYISDILKRRCLPSQTCIILEPNVNARWYSNHGLIFCGKRLTDYIMHQTDKALTALRAPSYSLKSRSAGKKLYKGLKRKLSTTETTLISDLPITHLHLSFVAHSMGGIIVRAALPTLRDAFASKYDLECASVNDLSSTRSGGVEKQRVVVHWDTFCTISTPHVGVAEMHSPLKASIGSMMSYFSASLRDMFLKTDVLEKTLLEDAYLSAWKAFARRILVCAINDKTVMSYSACFFITPEDRLRLESRGGVQPGSGKCSESAGSKGERKPSMSQLSGGVEATSSIKNENTSLVQIISRREDLGNGTNFVFELAELTPELWPTGILPRERAMVARIVEHVGSFHICAVDFRPQQAIYTGRSRLKARLGANRFSHRAIICMYPCNVPELFGFISEYIAECVLGDSRLPLPTLLSHGETLVPESERMSDIDITDRWSGNHSFNRLPNNPY